MRIHAALGLSVSMAFSPAFGGENKFIFVDRMPKAPGVLQRTLVFQDERDGLRTVQNVFAEDYQHALILAFVMSAYCSHDDSDQDKAPKIYVTAIKYLPKKLATFAVAGLHDIYKDVYVADKDGRTRLYEDVAPQSMLELSEAFKPACVRI